MAFNEKLQDVLKNKTKQKKHHEETRVGKHQNQTQLWQILKFTDWGFKSTMKKKIF